MEPASSFVPEFLRRHPRQMALVLGLLATGLLAACWLVPAEQKAVADQLLGFPDSHVASQQARPVIMALICLLPAVAALAYLLGDTLDRYITRRFVTMLGICLGAFYAIWLLIDLSDNLSEFQSSKNVLHTTLQYYGSRMPAVLLLLLPYALLLSLLESLGKLSTYREVIAIIQSGRSVARMCRPLMLAGILSTLFAAGINYHWAPVAEGSEQDLLELASGKHPAEARKVLYRNLHTQRLWMVSSFPADYEKGAPMVGVEVTTCNERNQLLERLSATEASWEPATGKWTFVNPLICHFTNGAAPVFEKPASPLVIDSWSETPWQIIKPGLSAQHLGIPDLNAWLDTHEKFPNMADAAPYLTHWHYRFALPFSCLITVLIAAPLAIHFSRRGAGGGIFLAVLLSALMMFTNTIILAFGESGHLPPMLTAWLPNALFGLIGVALLRRRMTGRPLHQELRRMFATT